MNEIQTQRHLADVLPVEFTQGAYERTPAMRLASTTVLEMHENNARPWPGKHKFVRNWYVLTGDKAVGWNENPSLGWTFPVITYMATQTDPPDSIEFEPLILRFPSGTHLRFHRVLVEAGFSYTVTSDNNVESDYKHPETGIGVTLTLEDDGLVASCLKADGKGVYGQDDYTGMQWATISQSGIDAVEMMRRELNALGLL